MRIVWLLPVVPALALGACGGNSVMSPAPGLPVAGIQRSLAPAGPTHQARGSGKIKHVVILIQENRSFNNLFYGFPGAKTARYGYNAANHKIKLKPVPLESQVDIEHDSAGFLAACNGTGSIPGTNCRMNGFDQQTMNCGGTNAPPCPNKHPPYSYVPHSETRPYFDIAKQYVLADEMYASNFDASSFISHQYIIAAQAVSAVNYPFGQWGCPGGSGDEVEIVGPQRQIPDGYEEPCWDPLTLGDELDQAGIRWAFYTAKIGGDLSLWSAYQAIKHIYFGKDWKKDIIYPQTRFFDDITNGKLRTVSWITPTWENSDHPGNDSNTGPSWVASVINAVGESKYWDSTAIFVFWDDYGGWYDPEPPAYVDYDGLGMRLPMLIVSAYAKKGHVSHVHYEHGSILKFVEDLYGLGRLSASDTRAKSPAHDAFDFSQPPRRFVPIQGPYSRYYFEHQPTDGRPPDYE